jgi:hypothetical protein
MAAFDGDIQTAKELIAEFGEVSKVRRVIPGVPDPAAPWKPVQPTTIEVPVTAVWLNYNLQSSGELYVGGSLVKTGDKKVLVAALDISDITPSDLLVRADGSVYKVANAKLLDPNGQKILWTLQAEQ